MHQMLVGVLLKLPLFFITALLTHLTVSFSQTVMHYTLAHRPLGGRLFRNHVGFTIGTIPKTILFRRGISLRRAISRHSFSFQFFSSEY